MSQFDQAVLGALLRTDLQSFVVKTFHTVAPGERYVHNWHVEVIVSALEHCLQGTTTRLIITIPPRYLKSHCASVALPAYALGWDPSLQIVCVSYAQDLAQKFHRDSRAILQSDWYRRTFPGTLISPEKSSETELMTTRRGYRLATSPGGMLTGRGADIIILDDPLKSADALSAAERDRTNQWFTNTLLSRLNNKEKGVIIVITQRLHVDDLPGLLLSQKGEWVHLNLAAIAEIDEQFALGDGFIVGRKAGEALHPARESLATLEKIRAMMGLYDFSAQYLQNPIPLDGGLIKLSWFRRYDVRPTRDPNDFLTLSWDTASTAKELGSYSVATVWLRRGDDHYLLDTVRKRLEFPLLKKLVIELHETWRPDAVLIEDKGSGTQLIQDLQYERKVHPISIVPTADKMTRMYGQTAKIESGQVHIPNAAPWLDDFMAEVLQFPRGRHNDQVDSVSQYLGWIGSAPSGDFEYWVGPSYAVIREFGWPERAVDGPWGPDRRDDL